MKNLLYTLLTICLAHTFSFGQESYVEDSILYLTPQEEAFMIDKKTTSLFKIQPLNNSLRNSVLENTLYLTFEQKLNKSFSISPILHLSNYSDLEGVNIGLGLEFRYYYKLARLIKEKKQANNLSSNYFASSFYTNFNPGDNVFKKSNNIELSYGIQKRFLNYGYLDFRINLGVSRFDLADSGIGPFRGSNAQNIHLTNETNIGIGLGKKYEITEDAKCPIFKCFSNRRSAFKINLNETWSLSRLLRSEQNQTILIMNPNITYEIKLGKSPISFEQDLSASFVFSDYQFNLINYKKNGFGFDGLNLEYRAGLKYYHSLKSRIRNGKSGNNLSGPYIFARGEYIYNHTYTTVKNENGFTEDKKIREHGQGVHLGYGYQQEVLKNLYYDISLGVTKGLGGYKYFDNFIVGLVSDIKVGMMF